MPDKVFECEYSPGEELVLRFRPRGLRIIPQAARGHIKTANRELLLALRSLLDDAIKAMEQGEKSETRSGGRRKTKIEVQ